MVEKVKLTREQAEFIKAYEENVDSYNGWEEYLLCEHSEQWEKSFKDAKIEAQCMKTISPLNLAKALLFGYEIEEEEFVTGELVKYWHKHNNRWVFGEYIKSSKGVVWAYWDGSTDVRWVAADIVSKATRKEIEAEKERMKWVELGREVGDLKHGDVYTYNGNAFYIIDNSSRIEVIQENYLKGELKGFYPAESFISFNK